MNVAAATLLIGIVVGLLFQEVWSFICDLFALYLEERDRE